MTVNGVTKNDASGTVVANTLTEVVFTNDDVEYGFFTVSKQVEYMNGSAAIADKLAAFEVLVRLDGYANKEVTVGGETYITNDQGVVLKQNGDTYTFKIKDGDIIRISDVPVGTAYTVIELTNNMPVGYAVVNGQGSGAVVAAGNGVVLQNRYTPVETRV